MDAPASTDARLHGEDDVAGVLQLGPRDASVSRLVPRPSDRLVLCYHSVSPHAATKLTVLRSALRRQLSTLLEDGYRGMTFEELVAGRRPEKGLAVTFDDSELSVLDHALPILSELGIPGTVFTPVGAVGSPGVTTWDDLSSLARSGWEVGSHACSHERLPNLDQDSLERELRESRAAIEDALARPCRSIAYPYGAVDDRVRAAAAAAGYTAGCTTTGTLRSADPLRWPRVGVNGHDGFTVFRAKTSRTGRAVRGTRVGQLLELGGRLARDREAKAQSRLRQT